MSEQATNEKNAIQILAMASDGYMRNLDELSKNFVGPQIKTAIQILASIVDERAAANEGVKAEAPLAPLES